MNQLNVNDIKKKDYLQKLAFCPLLPFPTNIVPYREKFTVSGSALQSMFPEFHHSYSCFKSSSKCKIAYASLKIKVSQDFMFALEQMFCSKNVTCTTGYNPQRCEISVLHHF